VSEGEGESEKEVQITGKHIRDILLENFWPKLVPLPESSPPMEIHIEDDGVALEIPNPVTHPVYSSFSNALKFARTRNESYCTSVKVGNAQKVTGHLAFELAILPEHGLVKDMCNRIALMRSSELVVKYLPVPQAVVDKDWVGVFLCSDANDIRRAFAMAEPPAHDDWIHEGLTDRNHKTWVKMTKLRLPELAMKRFGPVQTDERQPGVKPPSITEGLDEFSDRFLSGDGDAPAPTSSTGGGGGKGRGLLLKPQLIKRHVDDRNNIIASFGVSKQSGEAVIVCARVDIEGAERNALAEIPQDNRPRVLRWRLPSGEEVPGDQCTLAAGGEYQFEVQFRGRYSIKTKCEIIKGA
jgi:hypothetical protein